MQSSLCNEAPSINAQTRAGEGGGGSEEFANFGEFCLLSRRNTGIRLLLLLLLLVPRVSKKRVERSQWSSTSEESANIGRMMGKAFEFQKVCKSID